MNKSFILSKFSKKIEEMINVLRKKFLARYYKFIILISFNYKLSFFESYIKDKIYIKNKKYPLICLLNYERSPTEVEFLKKKFNLLLIDNLFLKEIILFLGDNVEKYSGNTNQIKKVNFFLNILKSINLKLIISPALHYKVNTLGYIAKLSNIKFIINHREGYHFAESHLKNLSLFFKKNIFKWKLVDKVIFHNNYYKNLFSKYGKYPLSRIEVIGPIRFHKLNNFKKNYNLKNRRKILFIGFTPSYVPWVSFNKFNKYDKNPNPFGNINYFIEKKSYQNNYEKHIYFYETFIESNLIFLKNIKKFPQYEFEMKIKWQDGRWVEIINKLIYKYIGSYPKNLKISYDGSVWNKIQQSFLVCGHGSTSLLEAGYLKTPSAQFICGELEQKKNESKNRISKNPLYNQYNSFLKIKNENDLTNLIENRSNLFSKKLYKKQKKLFLSYIANIDNENLEKKYENLINSII